MKTILMHAENPELSMAWASYLSQYGTAVFTSTDPIDAAEIISMTRLDALVVSSDDPDTFLALGKTLKRNNRRTKIVTISGIDPNDLASLLETNSHISLSVPFTFGELHRAVLGLEAKAEVTQNADVQ